MQEVKKRKVKYIIFKQKKSLFFNQKLACLCVWNTHGFKEPLVRSQKIGKCGVTNLMLVITRCLLFCMLIRNKVLSYYYLENRRRISISQEFETIFVINYTYPDRFNNSVMKVILSYAFQNSKNKDENWSIKLKSYLLQCFYTTINK